MSEASRRRAGRKSERPSPASPIHANHAVASSPFEAFRDVVYQYGVEALADELGTKRGTLYNKADADADSHHQPTLRDVINVTRVTGDARILESLDRMFDRAGFDISGELSKGRSGVRRGPAGSYIAYKFGAEGRGKLAP